jgi:hypothetical protein
VARKRFTRQQLHELVWTRPMRDLAAEIGISDVGLKKVCVKYGIDTPPQGHWQKVANGKQIATPVLTTGRLEQVIDIVVADPKPELPDAEQARLAELMGREVEPEWQIHVPADLPASVHPVAKQVQKILKACKLDDYGCLRCYDKALPFVRVTPDGLPRAVKLIDTIARAVERRGFVWRPGSGGQWDDSASVMVEDVAFKIGVYETVERRIHRLTPEEQRKTQKGTWFYAPKYDYLSSNQFSIRRSDYDTYLQDGRNLRVEDRLNEVMRILVGRAFAARENKRLEGIRAAEASARAARQAEIQKLQATQVAAIERLHAQASAWRKAQDLRAFIAAVEDAPDLCADARRSEWLSWAHGQADAVDPLSPDPARVLQVDFEAFARLQALTKAPATGDGKGM